MIHQTEQLSGGAEHTPGPWVVVQHTGFTEITAGDDWTVTGPNGEAICYEGGRIDAAAANARLIAAAPDLLAALKHLMSDTTSMADALAANKQARAAIAKAVGSERS